MLFTLFRRKTYTRCVLASDALHALVKSLAAVSPSAIENTHSAALSIRSHFCNCFSTNMALDFVKLGSRLEESFFRPRFEVVMNEINELATSAMSDSDVSSIGGLSTSSVVHSASKGQKNATHTFTNLFELWECHMCAYHTFFSIVIAGGGGRMPCLESPSQRLQVFHTIAEVEKEHRQSVKGDKHLAGHGLCARSSRKAKTAKCDETDKWPLHLPAVQCSFISAMVLFSSKPTAAYSSDINDWQLQQTVDLHFLCISFLNSFETMIKGPSQLQRASPGMIEIEGNAPVSFRDARLFSLAASKLPKAIQSQILTRFVGILHERMHSGTIGVENQDMCHVIARGIPVCMSLIDLLSSPNLVSVLAWEIEASLCFSLPRLVPSQRHFTFIESNQVDSILFSKDFFQSIFPDWQSPVAPTSDAECTSVLDNTITEHLVSAISLALTVGFETSVVDGCHLLFSSWNAAYKIYLWRSMSWNGPASATIVKSLSLVERILRLREDMCGLHHLMQNIETSSQVDGGETLSPHHSPNKTLFSALDYAEESISFLTLELDTNAATNTATDFTAPTRATFAYYEAVPLYISFLISMHSFAEPNDMGLSHRLKTAKSSVFSARGSKLLQLTAEEIDSKDGGNKLRMNALTRLHKSCLALGAAPCYPDWLDASCKLRQDITPSVALDSANRALLALTRFGINVWKSYFDAMVEVLRILDESGDVKMCNADEENSTAAYHRALYFFIAQQRQPSELSDTFYFNVASSCQTNSLLFKLLVLSLSRQSRLSGGELVTTTAQRILGANFFKPRKVHRGEHRANGQWETLLSEVLQGSALKDLIPYNLKAAVGALGSDDDSTPTLKRITDSLALVHHWRRVLCSVVDAMVPAAALLRFSINDGKGQDRNATSSEDTSSGTSVLASGLSGCKISPTKMLHNHKASTTIKQALTFLSFVAASSPQDEDIRLTSRAAAGPLLECFSHFDDLLARWFVINSCDAIGRGVRTLEEKEGLRTRSQKDSLCVMIRLTLKQFSDTTVEEDTDGISLPTIGLNSSFNAEKITAFQSFIGANQMKERKGISDESSMDLMEILAESDQIGLTNRDTAALLGSKEISLLLHLLCGKVLGLRGRVPTFVADMLIQLMDIKSAFSKEKSMSSNSSTIEVLRTSAASLLDELPKEDIRSLVGNLSVNAADPSDALVLLSRKTAVVVGFLACVLRTGCSEFPMYKIIFAELLSSLDRWAGSSNHHHLVKLLFLLATRFGTLHDAGRAIILLLMAKSKKGETVSQQNVYTLKKFLELVSSLDRLVNRKLPLGTQSVETFRDRRYLTSHTVDDMTVTLKNGTEVPRTCSFIETGEGFTEQHWYNCYTCGLIWEKVLSF